MSKRSVLYNGNNRSPKTPDQLTLRSILGRLLTRSSMADTCCQTELFYTPLTWKKRHFFYTRNLLHSPQIVLFLSPRERRWLLSLRPESPEKASSSPVFSLLSSRCCFWCFFFSLQAGETRLSRALEREWTRVAKLASFYTFSGGGNSGWFTACLIGGEPGESEGSPRGVRRGV